ncbi:cyclin-domain-containing protein [Mucidula mucida]|nr:cyclin-domain-containing protein [Mucidula mucida]
MESASTELPAAFELASIEVIVDLIADMLERLMAHNDRIALSPESLTRFHSRSAPAISVLDYLKRIVKFINVEKTCLLITLHYIDQICSQMPLFTLSSLTCHRFIITSVAVSSKCLCDTFCTNALYAKVGGITVTELNILEREFLAMINWRLMTTREVLNEYYVNLVRTHSKGTYVLETTSEDSDTEMDFESEYSSPSSLSQRRTPTAGLPPPRATIEQNMAFAALQQSQRMESTSGDG